MNLENDRAGIPDAWNLKSILQTISYQYDLGINVDWATISAVKRDSFGNIYIAGDSGYAYGNAFISKLSPDGKPQWGKTIGSPFWDRALDLLVDPHDNIYLVGKTNGNLRRGGGETGWNYNMQNLSHPNFSIANPYPFPRQVSYDIFVTRFDASGKDGGTRTFGSPSEDEFRWAFLASDNTIVIQYDQISTPYIIKIGEGVTQEYQVTGDSVFVNVNSSGLSEDSADSLVYTFIRTGNASTALTVNYTIGGSATNGTDYATILGNVTFVAGSSTATVTVDPTADSTVESDETVVLQLAAGTGYSIGTTTAVTGTITNDDVVLPTVTLAASPASVAEDGTSNLIYTFSRTGATTNALTVNYTIGGSATNGTDYATIPTAVTFAAGLSTATVTVDPTIDKQYEGNESVIISLVESKDYFAGTSRSATGTISNDDPLLPWISTSISGLETLTEDYPANNSMFKITRNLTSVEKPLTFSYKLVGTATIGNDYTTEKIPGFSQGYSPQLVTGDLVGQDIRFATFNANSQTIFIPISSNPDSTYEQDETVILTILPGDSYNIALSEPTLYIVNDDVALPTVTLALSPVSVAEDGTSNLIYTFSRTGTITNALTVNYTIGGSATNGTDYATILGSVTFVAGSSTATVTVDPTADSTVESDETVQLQLAAGTGYSIGTTTAVTGTITNDDVADTTAPTISKLSVNGSALTLTLNETLKSTVPDVGLFAVQVGGTARNVSTASVNATGKSVTLQLASAVTNGQAVTLAYTDKTLNTNDLSGVIEDAAGNDLASFTARSVTNVTPILASVSTTLASTQLNLTLTGTKRISGTGNSLNNIIIGNSSNNRLMGAGGKDTLTGGGTTDSDIFAYNSLSETLLGGYDVITDFNNRDRIQAPLAVLDESEVLIGSKGTATGLNGTAIGNVLTSSAFTANAVAAFTVTAQTGTFVAMNDGRAGFQADSDAIIHLQNYTISSTNFVDFI